MKHGYLGILPFLGCLAACSSDLVVHKTDTNIDLNTIQESPFASPSPDPEVPPPPTIQTTIKSLRPALAVRGPGCMTCHAQINGSLITDFGWGDDYFFGGNQNADWQMYYGNPTTSFGYLSFQSAQITNGSIIVPKNAKIMRSNRDRVLNAVDPNRLLQEVSLANFISLPYTAFIGGVSNPTSMDAVISPRPGQPKVIERENFYIGAPTQAMLLSLFPTIPQSIDFRFQKDGSNAPNLSGIAVAPSGSYVKNIENTINCVGDLMVKGPLFLNNAQIQTNEKGCRIYATGLVAIQGELRALGSEVANIQISSSRAIEIGFNYAKFRLWEGFAPFPPYLTYKYDRESTRRLQNQGGSLQDHINSVNNEASADLNVISASESLVFNESSNISYSKILLNAPHVYITRNSEFSGAIIAETLTPTIKRVGENFKFHYDPTFEDSRVPIFPLYEGKVEILKAE